MDSTELFVLLLFLVALPLLLVLFRNSELPGTRFFLWSFLFLLASNVFTVVESWIYPTLFDVLEHLFNTFAAAAFFMAIRQFIISRRNAVQTKSDERVGL